MKITYDTWDHNKLCEDLALAIRTPLLSVPLGSPYLGHVQVADVIAVKPSYTRFCLSLYEVKVSRADFLGDLRREKWRGYLDHCHRLYFAVPEGMIDKSEVPAEAGLMVRSDKGWTCKKHPQKRDVTIPERTLLSMVFLKERTTVRERSLEAALGRSGGWRDTDRHARQARHLGKRIAEALRTQAEAAEMRSYYERITRNIEQAYKEGRPLDTWIFDRERYLSLHRKHDPHWYMEYFEGRIW
jgi:hypothetical protein